MKELITQSQAEIVLKIIAFAAPIPGALIGAFIGSARKRGAVIGFVIGLGGTAIYGLWKVYTALGERFGYTSAGSLIVQMIVFAATGIAAGFLIHRDFNSAGNGDIQKSKIVQEEKVNAS